MRGKRRLVARVSVKLNVCIWQFLVVIFFRRLTFYSYESLFSVAGGVGSVAACVMLKRYSKTLPQFTHGAEFIFDLHIAWYSTYAICDF